MEKRPDHELEQRRGRGRGVHRGYAPDEFFGLDVERMSPKAHIVAALAVLVPVAAGVILVLSLIPELFWLIFVFGWMIFPAFGLLIRGIAGLSEAKTSLPSADGKERELLEALRREGELTPARAAMETSLTVAEADRMLKELAEGGHLEVRVRGGGLFYALWEPEDAAPEPEEDRG